MAVDRTAVVYTGSNFGGRGHGFSLPEGSRYHAVDVFSMMDLELYDRINSLTIRESEGSDALSMIVFSDYNSFYGRFIQATARKDMEYSIASLPEWSFGSNEEYKPRSILFVRRDEEEVRFSLRTLLALIDVNGMVSAGTAAASRTSKLIRSVEPDGDMICYWTPFPSSISGLSSTRVYFSLWQKLTVNLKSFLLKTYTVSMQFHLFFYIVRGQLVGRVETYETWVESGTLESIVSIAVEAAAGRVANDLNIQLDDIGTKRLFVTRDYAHAFLLPGEQAGGQAWPTQGIDARTSDPADDVTLVLVEDQ